jgi:bilirubin oxidase
MPPPTNYDIGVRQFRQQILPSPLPMTTVWSYGAVNEPASFNYPAFTIEATAGRATRVTWINQLLDSQGRYLPHLLPVDQTLALRDPDRASRPIVQRER